MIVKVTAAYVRKYSDSGQITAYVEWVDERGQSCRTEGKPHGLHMAELFRRAKREKVVARSETW
jgi:hypothetical protein